MMESLHASAILSSVKAYSLNDAVRDSQYFLD